MERAMSTPPRPVRRRGKIILGIVLALIALAGYAGVIIRIGWFD